MSSTYSPRQVESNLSDTDEMQSEEECECSPRLILITQNWPRSSWQAMNRPFLWMSSEWSLSISSTTTPLDVRCPEPDMQGRRGRNDPYPLENIRVMGCKQGSSFGSIDLGG
jgi:hypothetical protein